MLRYYEIIITPYVIERALMMLMILMAAHVDDVADDIRITRYTTPGTWLRRVTLSNTNTYAVL